MLWGGKKTKQQTPPKKKPNPNQQALPELEASTLPGARRAPREGRVSVLLSVCAWLCVVSGGTEVLPPPSVTPAGVCVCLRSSSDLRGWRGERWEAAAPPAPPALCRARMFPPASSHPFCPPQSEMLCWGVPGVMQEMGVQWCGAGVTLSPPSPPSVVRAGGLGAIPCSRSRTAALKSLVHE